MEGIEQFIFVIILVVLALGQWVMDKVRKARMGEAEEEADEDVPDWFPGVDADDDVPEPNWQELLSRHEQHGIESGTTESQQAPQERPFVSVPVSPPREKQREPAPTPAAPTTVSKDATPSWAKPPAPPLPRFGNIHHRPYKSSGRGRHPKAIKIRTLLQRQNLRSLIIGAEIIGKPVALRDKKTGGMSL